MTAARYVHSHGYVTDVETGAGMRLSEIWWVCYRSLKKLSRSPVVLLFTLLMPVIWLGLFSQVFGTIFSAGAAGLTGAKLPYDYVAVLLPGIAIMTAITSSSQTGFSMVMDIDSGFMDKFFVAPMQRSSVLIGKLLADGMRMGGQAGLVLAIAYAFKLGLGWRIPFASGLPGDLMIMFLAATFGLAFSGLSNTVALRTKNTESTQLVSFTLTFPLLFLSTALLPKALLPGWVQTFSSFNPVSYTATACRDLILTGFNWPDIGNAVLSIAILGFILNGLAVLSFRALGR
ncbi:MAG: ABC transporter permease [Thermoplasmata archaeon]